MQKETSRQLLARLTSDTSIIPKYEEVEKLTTDLMKRHPLQYLFGHNIVDTQGNIVRKYESDEEKNYLALLTHWGISFKTYEILITILLEEAIQQDKLSWKEIEKFIKENLWYGKEYEIEIDKEKGLNMQSAKWVELLESGIKSYLSELQNLKKASQKKSAYQVNLVSAVDTLVLKIEGIIREFYQEIGIHTDKSKRRGNQLLLEKMDLNDLLRDPKAEEIFGPSLLLLMKYVLIEPVGFNIRNNVAHAFLLRQNYTLLHAHLVFIILLRIGNYQTLEKAETAANA